MAAKKTPEGERRLAFIDLPGSKLQFFSDVGRMLEKEGLCRCLFFSSSVKSRSRLRRLGWTVYPQRRELETAICFLAEEEIKDLAEFQIGCRGGEKGKIESRIREESERFYGFFRDNSIDSIFVWNGWDLSPHTAVCVARKMGIGTLFAENGYFPFTMQIDSEGVNFNSSLSKKDKAFFEAQSPDPLRMEEFLRFIEAVKKKDLPKYAPLKKRVHASPLAKLLAWYQRVSGQERLIEEDPGMPSDKINDWEEFTGELPSRFLFLPFQVHDDTQLLLHSPLVGSSMKDFVSLCYDAIKTSAPGYKIVAKLHPHDIRRKDYTDLVRSYPDIMWLKKYDMNKILDSASAVITINSTVGFEALIYGKPVITLGNNFYCIDGITFKVNRKSELNSAIAKALQEHIDPELLNKFLFYCYDYYFAMGTFRDHSYKSIDGVKSKIANILVDGKSVKYSV